MKQSTVTSCNKTPSWIVGAAKALANRFDFRAGEDIKNIVSALGGKVIYVSPSNATFGRASISVPGKDCRFEINISNLSFPLQERYDIAHELGHYVLHSRFGECKINANASHIGSIVERPEYEAHLFASALLMPKDEIEKLESPSTASIAAHFQVPLHIARGWIECLIEFNEQSA